MPRFFLATSNETPLVAEADLAFKVKGIGGEDIFFGILLEHKSSPSDDILSQLYRYTYEVMVDKKDKEFAWMPTKAIVVYNAPGNRANAETD